MELSQYPRPTDDTGLGIHGGANWAFPFGETEEGEDWFLNEFHLMGFRWAKLLNGGKASALRVSQKLLASGCIPIVRLYRNQPNPGTLEDDTDQHATLHLLTEAGVKYFEVNNEPMIYGVAF